MSDEIDWLPVAVWSTGVFLQVDSAIRSWWTNRGIREWQRRLIETDWSKIQRGETKRGFRMWLERHCCANKPNSEEESHYYPVKSLLSNDYDWNEWIKHELRSVFMMIVHPMPNSSQHVLNLRRYSFYAPKIYTDIARVIYPTGEGWISRLDMQLDDRTIAMTYTNTWSERMCIVFIDIKQRSYRVLSIPPILSIHNGLIKIMHVQRGDRKRPNRLRMVCGYRRWDQYEVISIDYEIRPSKKNPSRLFAMEMGRQSIVIPGSRMCTTFYIPGTYVLHANGQNQSSYAVTIDQRGDFQVHHYDEWKRAIMATDFGRRSRKAIEDLEAALPEEWRDECHLNQYYKHALGNVGDSFAKRQIYPPSMMHVAAEAICQSKPHNADMSRIKSETGIDIFDGIYEDQKKPVLTIYLPSNAELVPDE